MKNNVIAVLLATVLFMMSSIVMPSVKADTSGLSNKCIQPVVLGASRYTNSHGVAYERSLDEHIDYVRSELERYEEATAYFEKYGISFSLRNYIVNNGLDTSYPELNELVRLNEAHISELLENEEEYDVFLKNNAEFFIDKCDELLILNTYNEINDMCDILLFYYYNMDVSFAGVQDAIGIYTQKKQQLSDMEKSAENFIDAVGLYLRALEGDDNDAIASMMLAANYAYNGVDKGIAGVVEARETLNDRMAEYDATVFGVNKELTVVNETMSSVMNHDGVESFLSMIRKVITGDENE